MKLKKSNSHSKVLLFGLIAVVFILLLIKGSVFSEKPGKYVATPVFEQTTPLDFIQLTLTEKNYNKLKEKRDKAISIGILETKDSDYVPANVTFNGVDYWAEVRLKGDWTDHLVGDKWSFRIKLKNDKTILGMRKFSIHHPKTRGYVNEWLFHKAVKKENLIGLRYNFIEGAIHIKQKNGSEYINKPLGIYAIEETFDKRTIESNKRKESVILKFSENYWWNEVKKSMSVGKDFGLTYGKFMQRAEYPVNAFSESKVLQDSIMQNYFHLGKTLLKGAREGDIALSDAFDAKKLALNNALLNLFGAAHGNSIINIRFYYNPITSKLEPIAFDGNSGKRLQRYEDFNFIKNNKKRDSIYDKELARALAKVSKPEYLEDIIKKHQSKISNFGEMLKAEFNTAGINLDNIRYNQNILRNELDRLIETYNLTDVENESSLDDKELEIELPDISNWSFTNVKTDQTNLIYKDQKVHDLRRKNTENSSLSIIKNIQVNYGYYYKLDIVAKQDTNSFLGLRIQGSYPDRVDAVFNLETGKLKGVSKAGGFESENATIEPLGGGYYKCTLSGEINASAVSLLIGTTSTQNKILSWEAKSNNVNSVKIVPKSLKLEILRR